MSRPSVGLLFNATTPEVMVDSSQLVEHLAVIPAQFFYDFGPPEFRPQRFIFPQSLLEMIQPWLQGRRITAHGFGMSLPTAQPLDGELVAAIRKVGDAMGGFAWISEHLNLLAPPKADEPHTDGAMALPVSYDEESFQVLMAKVKHLGMDLPARVLLENPAIFTPLQEMEMAEPEFLNRLHHEGYCGVLLDLHNLLVSARNGGMDIPTYLASLDPMAVEEVHLAGGEELYGFYTDSHSQLPPEEIWDMAYDFLPRCGNLRAITFEYNDSYFDQIGSDGVRSVLQQMHSLADACCRK